MPDTPIRADELAVLDERQAALQRNRTWQRHHGDTALRPHCLQSPWWDASAGWRRVLSPRDPARSFLRAVDAFQVHQVAPSSRMAMTTCQPLRRPPRALPRDALGVLQGKDHLLKH